MSDDSSVSGNSSSSKSLLWMMIALFAGIGVLLGGGLFLANRVVRTIGLSVSTPKNTIKTPGGNFRLEKENEIGPGLPVYPGAALVLPGENSVGEATIDAQAGRRISTYYSNDTRELADSWYQAHLSKEYLRHPGGENPLPAVLLQARISSEDIAFVAERGKQVRVVALSPDSTGTKISLIQFDKPDADQGTK